MGKEDDESLKVEVAVPGEWALKKTLGPTFDVLGRDLAGVYEKGRDKIVEVASKRIKDLNDGKASNLRVTRDIFWNGSFSEQEVCAEYFGGLLASSRSENGSDDSAIAFVDTIRSLSSGQLRLHYAIFRGFNFHASRTENRIVVSKGGDLSKERLYFSLDEIRNEFGVNTEVDISRLHNIGLITYYEYRAVPVVDSSGKARKLSYLAVAPSKYGVSLYSAVCNRLSDWRHFSKVDFGEFGDLGTPRTVAFSFDNFLAQSGVKKPS